MAKTTSSRWMWTLVGLIALVLPLSVLIPSVLNTWNAAANYDEDQDGFYVGTELVKANSSAAGTIVAIVGGIALFLNFNRMARTTELTEENLLLAQRRFEQDAKRMVRDFQLAELRLNTERFSQAIALLGSSEVTARIGAIYALKQIAQEAPDLYQWTVIELLTAYVHEASHPPRQEATFPPVNEDIQAIMTLLVRREVEQDQYPIDLSNTYLVGARLSQVDLKKANLSEAVLTHARFVQARLNETQFTGAIAEQVDFTEANLEDAHFVKALLTSAQFHKAQLPKADLSYARLEQAELVNANLTSANLEGSHLRDANLRCVTLKGANLSHSDLQNVELSFADLSQSLFQSVLLKHGNLSEAQCPGAEFLESDLSHANLTHANLKNAKFEAVNFTNANLTHANLEGATFIRMDPAHVTLEQLQQAHNWQLAKYEPAFAAHLGLTDALIAKTERR